MGVAHRSVTVAVALVAAIAAAAGPEDFLMKINGTGKADGIGLHARQQAIADAQEAALQALAGSILGFDKSDLLGTLVEQSAEFVHSANVVDHKTDQGATRVSVEFLVNIVQIRNAAVRLLLPSMSYKPRVLVLVADILNADDVPADATYAETALADACRATGLEIVDTRPIRAAFSSKDLATQLQDENAGRRFLGYDAQVDVAIIGVARAERVPSDVPTNLQANKAHLELRVIRADDGRLMDAAAIDAIVHSVDFIEGAAQAIQDACGKLAPQMINAAALAVVGPETTDGYALTVQQAGPHANLETLGNALGQLGAQDVKEVFYSNDVARLYFYYPGELHELVKPLIEQRYPAFRLEQLQTYGRRSLLRLHPGES